MLRRAIPELVGRDGPVTRRLASLVAERRQQLIPTRQNKIRERDPLARILVRFDSERTRRQPTERVVAHAAAIAFPGPVPVGSLPTLRRLVLDLRTHGRHSLGLYAAPGHRVFVRFGDGRLAPGRGRAEAPAEGGNGGGG